MKRLYQTALIVGAKEYDWRTRAPLAYHPGPVKDAEAFCRKALDEAMAGWGMWLRPDEYDDSLAELIFTLYRLERKYDPERTATFEQYARAIIQRRAVDAGPRRVLGRNGARIHDYVFDDLSDASEGLGLVDAFTEGPGDQTLSSGRVSRRTEPGYARERARAIRLLGINPPR